MDHNTEEIESLGHARLVGYYENNSPEWHDERKGAIGGSDIAAIMGKSPWKSYYTLWAEKSGLIDDDIEPTMAMKLGTAFEPVIRQLWAEDNAQWLQVTDTGTWASNTFPTWKANPDGIIRWNDGELGILEIKHTSQWWDRLPDAYELQVQWYLHLLGLQRGIVVAVAGGYWREFEVEYDLELMQAVQLSVAEFEHLVANGIEPGFDGSTSTYETIRALSPGIKDEDYELGNLYSELILAKETADEAEEQLQELKSIVLAKMDGAKYGTFNGQKVITLQSRGGKPFITFK
jgi:putative phage-type endonuclease